MKSDEITYFLDHIQQYTQQEIFDNMEHINKYFRRINYWSFNKEYIEKILQLIDKNKLIYELFKDENKFLWWDKILDLPEKLKFGVEIEVSSLPIDAIRYAFESKSIYAIMNILRVPSNISRHIIENVDFEKKTSLVSGYFLKKYLMMNQKHLLRLCKIIYLT